MKFKIHELKCKFCNAKCGEYKYPEELTVAKLKIADVRCGDCEKTRGTYKEELKKAEEEKLKLGSKIKSKKK